MRKRFWAMLLALVMLLTLAACGKEEAPAQTEGEETGETENAPDTSEPDGLVLTEDENLTVKLVSIDEDGFWGYTLNVYMENKTDIGLMVSMDEVSVNGYMCDPYWGEEIAAGASLYSEVSFFRSDLEANGIDTVTEILFTLSARDYEDIFADPILEKPCAIYPLGEDAAVQGEREPQESDTVLVDNASVSVIVTGIDPNGDWGYTVKVYLENKTDKTLMFSGDRFAVNGYMCDPLWAIEVAGGKKASSEIAFMEGDLEAIGVDTVTAVTFTLSVSDANDWLADPVLKQECALYPMGEAAAVWEERESLPTDVVVFNNDYAKMVVIGETSDSMFGYGLQVYLENKTDKTLTFSMEDGAVNEFGCNPFWSAEVAPGMRCISTIGWFESDLADFAITQVDTITGKVIVSDSDDWFADPLYKKTIKIDP